jgi:hypothetical protein
VWATSRAEFMSAAAKRAPVVAFVDFDLLPQVEGATTNLAIVGIIDETLAGAIRSLNSFPWLSHLVTTTMLSTPLARAHLTTLLERLAFGPEQQVLGATGIGRVALLTSSTRREARFERMREFFTTHGVSPRTISTISDVAEELVTNALYDAPAEAGYFKSTVPRSEDVELPPEHACEISYGIEQGNVFVRIRDPFGALTRTRLLGVLNRCNATGVSLDESRGGAGLGLWRVFSAASTIAITVIPGRLTDILVRLETKKSRSTGKQLRAVHMFFPVDHSLDGARGRFAADHDYDLMDDSFTFMVFPESQ